MPGSRQWGWLRMTKPIARQDRLDTDDKMKLTQTLPALVALLIGSAICSNLVLAADGRDEYWAVIDRFFEHLAMDESQDAVNLLTRMTPYAEEIEAEMANVAFQLGALENTMGQYRAHEVLLHEVVAGRLAYLYVFVAYDRQPLKMEFQFYRPQDEWRFKNYSFSDKIDQEIVELAKIRLLDNVVP